MNVYQLVLKLTFSEIKEINQLTKNLDISTLRNHISDSLRIYEKRNEAVVDVTEEEITTVLTTYLVILQTKEVSEEIHNIVFAAMRKILHLLEGNGKIKVLISSFIVTLTKPIQQKDKITTQKLHFVEECLRFEDDVSIIQKALKWFINCYENVSIHLNLPFAPNTLTIILECIGDCVNSRLAHFLKVNDSDKFKQLVSITLGRECSVFPLIYLLVIKKIHDVYSEYYPTIYENNDFLLVLKSLIIPRLLAIISLQTILLIEELHLVKETFLFLNDIFVEASKLKIEFESYFVQLVYLIEFIYSDRSEGRNQLKKEKGDEVLYCVYSNIFSILSIKNSMAKLYLNYDCDEFCTDLFQFFMMTLFKHLNSGGYQLLPLVLKSLQSINFIETHKNFDWESALKRKKEWRIVGSMFNDNFDNAIEEYMKYNEIKEKTPLVVAEIFTKVPQINKIKMMEYFVEGKEFNDAVFKEYTNLVGFTKLKISEAFIQISKHVCLPNDRNKTIKLFELFGEEYLAQNPNEELNPKQITIAFFEALNKLNTFEEFLERTKEIHLSKEEKFVLFDYTNSQQLIVLNNLPTTSPTQYLHEEFLLREKLCRKEVEMDMGVYKQFYPIYCNLALSVLAKSELFGTIEKELYERIIENSILFKETDIIRNSIHQLIQLSETLLNDQFLMEKKKMMMTILLAKEIGKCVSLMLETEEIARFIGKLERYELLTKPQNNSVPYIQFVKAKEQEKGWFSGFLYDGPDKDKVKEYIKTQIKDEDLFGQLNEEEVILIVKYLMMLSKEVKGEERLEMLSVLQVLIISQKEVLGKIIRLLLNEKTFSMESFPYFEYCLALINYCLVNKIEIDNEVLIDFIISQPYEHFAPIMPLIQSFFVNMTNNPSTIQRIVEKIPTLLPIACNELLKSVNTTTVKTVCSLIRHLPNGKNRDSLVKSLVLAVGANKGSDGWEDCLGVCIETMVLNHSIDKEWLLLSQKEEVDIVVLIKNLSDIQLNQTNAGLVGAIVLELETIQRQKEVNEIVEGYCMEILLKCFHLDKNVGKLIISHIELLSKEHSNVFYEGSSLYKTVTEYIPSELLPKNETKESGVEDKKEVVKEVNVVPQEGH